MQPVKLFNVACHIEQFYRFPALKFKNSEQTRLQQLVKICLECKEKTIPGASFSSVSKQKNPLQFYLRHFVSIYGLSSTFYCLQSVYWLQGRTVAYIESLPSSNPTCVSVRLIVGIPPLDASFICCVTKYLTLVYPAMGYIFLDVNNK
jgi:hypothetical protein